MAKKIFRISILLTFGLSLVHCSGAQFGGGGGDEQDSSVQTDGRNSEPVRPEDPDDTNTQRGEAQVFQATLINGGLSFDTVVVDIEIAESESPVLLFLHLMQPTIINLSGDVESVAAIFLSANTNLYDLPLSEVRLTGGENFSQDLISTGFFPDYRSGSSLPGVIGQEASEAWANGVEVSLFAESLGPRRCYDLVFDTDIDVTRPLFSLQWAQGQACLY